LLIDDGQLEAARDALVDLEVEFECVQGDEIEEGIEFPRDLLVTGAQRAFSIAEEQGVPEEGHRPTWISVHHQDFLPFRDRLREIGVDYLVHTAVDRVSLRLLFLHALYRGPQKRNRPRLPVGTRVCCKIGHRWWPATLTDLSVDGCRILASHVPGLESPVTIQLLPDLGRGSLLELHGTVVRAERDASADPASQVSVAVALDAPDADVMERLQTILEGRVIGSLVTHLQETESVHAAEPKEETDSAERRRQPRVSYPRQVPALVGDATRVLIGRDLSVEGMRVEPHPGLTVGSAIQVAIHTSERGEPVIVDARVVGDEGEMGLRLRFTSKPDDAGDLEELVERLAPVESLQSTEDGGRPLVVSKILSVDRG
jgi:hypothetical protein